MYVLLTILIVIAAILLILLVLVQNSKGGGLAAGFSSGNQVMGAPKTADNRLVGAGDVQAVAGRAAPTAAEGTVNVDDPRRGILRVLLQVGECCYRNGCWGGALPG